MSEREQELLNDHLSRSLSYLEYGSGGSTVLACSKSNLKTIHSVESDFSFINELSNEGSIAKSIQNNRLNFYFANLGETDRWGVPINKEKKHLWSLYSLIPFADSENQINYDLVLIDGRFRIACAIAVALENPNCTVLIHDYFRRPQYWVLERFYEIANRADTLVDLRLKKNIDPNSLTKTFCTFCHIPKDRTGIYRIKMVRSLLKRLRKS